MQTNKLIHIDDDTAFSQILARRLARHQWYSEAHETVASALASTTKCQAILLDLNLESESSLSAIEAIKERWPQARLVVLTGYASIATTVYAMKKGADDYLSKPVEIQILLDSLNHTESKEKTPRVEQKPLTPDALEWELIQQALLKYGGNISATARALNMHRRTLQRKLQRKSPYGTIFSEK